MVLQRENKIGTQNISGIFSREKSNRRISNKSRLFNLNFGEWTAFKKTYGISFCETTELLCSFVDDPRNRNIFSSGWILTASTGVKIDHVCKQTFLYATWAKTRIKTRTNYPFKNCLYFHIPQEIFETNFNIIFILISYN